VRGETVKGSARRLNRKKRWNFTGCSTVIYTARSRRSWTVCILSHLLEDQGPPYLSPSKSIVARAYVNQHPAPTLKHTHVKCLIGSKGLIWHIYILSNTCCPSVWWLPLNTAVSRHAGVLNFVLFTLLTTALGFRILEWPYYGIVGGQTHSITYTPRNATVSEPFVPACYVY
jgi:hypothetical protein